MHMVRNFRIRSYTLPCILTRGMASTVLLGVCDARITCVQLSPFENKIGGYPDLFSVENLPYLPRCQLCHRQLVLLVQIYCPLESSEYHRLLHVYCCAHPGCWNQSQSWVVLRSQIKESKRAQSSVSGLRAGDAVGRKGPDFPVEEWCDDANDWGQSESLDTGEDDVEAGPVVLGMSSATTVSTVTEKLEDLRLSNPDLQSVTTPTSSGPCLPSFYINVFEDSSPCSLVATDSAAVHADTLLRQYLRSAKMDVKAQLGNKSSTSACREGYEKTLTKHGDAQFHRFRKQLQHFPTQVIRYERRGCPLLITDHLSFQPAGSFRCCYCGSESVFEMQLMPQLVYIVSNSVRETSGPSRDVNGGQLPPEWGTEFGTVLVYCCSSSCWEDSDGVCRKEHIVVQPDPDY